MEALLLERQEEITELKRQLKLQIETQFCQKASLSSSLEDPALVHDAIGSSGKNSPEKEFEEEKDVASHGGTQEASGSPVHDNDVDMSPGDSSTGTARKKEETKTLETFLDDTFQVQRYMVATRRKPMEVRSKIASGFVEIPEELEKSAGSFDIKFFAENIKTLFQEVQRDLEVRITRIIGDLEGTLACEGMIRMRR
ncbi:hypothetical protein OIU78_014865 [Salix suchowensis]|nr:hypothetical protein OIU78_014865 [Salix suchowensis]